MGVESPASRYKLNFLAEHSRFLGGFFSHVRHANAVSCNAAAVMVKTEWRFHQALVWVGHVSEQAYSCRLRICLRAFGPLVNQMVFQGVAGELRIGAKCRFFNDAGAVAADRFNADMQPDANFGQAFAG